MLSSAGTIRLPVVYPHQEQKGWYDASGRYEEDHPQIQIQNSRTSDGLDSTLSIFATKSNRSTSDTSASIYLANFAPDDGSGSVPAYNYSRTVILELQCLAELLGDRSLDNITVTATTINSTCANPKLLWETEMGSIKWPNAQQLEALHHASQPCTEELPVSVLHDSTRGMAINATTVSVTVTLEPYAAVALVVS